MKFAFVTLGTHKNWSIQKLEYINTGKLITHLILFSLYLCVVFASRWTRKDAFFSEFVVNAQVKASIPSHALWLEELLMRFIVLFPSHCSFSYIVSSHIQRAAITCFICEALGLNRILSHFICPYCLSPTDFL